MPYYLPTDDSLKEAETSGRYWHMPGRAPSALSAAPPPNNLSRRIGALVAASAERFIRTVDYVPPWSVKRIEEARRLSELEDGWDGGEAPAPSAPSVTQAIEVIRLCDVMGIRIDRVSADVDGGVALYAFAGALRVSVMISNEGEVALVHRAGAQSLVFEVEDGDERALHYRLEQAQIFLSGPPATAR